MSVNAKQIQKINYFSKVPEDFCTEIAKAVETIFDVEVEKVNVRNSKHGKHASVKLAEGYDAEDAAMRLGAF